MFKQYQYHGRRYWEITVGRWSWETYDWSLAKKVEHPIAKDYHEVQFALRCGECRRFTWGCRDHWFCGLCPNCEFFLGD